MLFYKDLALLHSIANKQTLFFAEMIARMDGENIVQMTAYNREAIIESIGSKTNDKLALARQYIKTLSDAKLIKDLGKGAYMICPKIAGFVNSVDVINKKQKIFMKIAYPKDGERTIEMEFEDEQDDTDPYLEDYS